VIFMVTAPMMQTGVAVQLPQTTAAAPLKTDDSPLVVSVTRDGALYLNDVSMDLEALTTKLLAIHKENPGKTVYLRGDHAASYGLVVGVIAALTKSDLKFPEPLYIGLTIYLLIAIGFKGGVAIAEAGIAKVWLPALAAMMLGALIPLWTFPLLRYGGKLSAVDAAARLGPNDARLEYYRGVALVLAKRDPAAAEKHLRAYLQTVPDGSQVPSHSSAHVWLGKLYEAEGKRDQAAAAYQSALSLSVGPTMSDSLP